MEAGHELKMVSVRLVDEPPLLGSKKVKTVQDAAEVMAKELRQGIVLYSELTDERAGDQCQYRGYGNLELVPGVPA